MLRPRLNHLVLFFSVLGIDVIHGRCDGYTVNNDGDPHCQQSSRPDGIRFIESCLVDRSQPSDTEHGDHELLARRKAGA